MRVALVALVLATFVRAAFADGTGGGPFPSPPAGGNCRTPQEQALTRARLARLPARVPPVPGQAMTTLYADPMSGGINGYERTVINYVDLDPSAGLLDWNCGQTTYDGHAGVDIEIADFYEMDSGVPILCAAPGTVVDAHDGEYDRWTAWDPSHIANYVIVQHADGTYAYYWHMRTNSVRVQPGHLVATGDTLGLVGSSGYSTGPHLHFETEDAGAREPYTGPCQGLTSLWQSQGPYVWAYPQQLMENGITSIAPITWPLVLERPPSKTHVVKGSVVTSWIRLRNFSTSDLLTFTFYSPLGQYATYPFASGVSYSTGWYYASRNLNPPSTYYGAWHVNVILNGNLLTTQYFTLDATPNQLPTIAPRTLWVRENDSLDVDLAGTDPDGTVFWHNLVSAPGHGTAALRGTRRHLLHYVATPGFEGLDSVTVQAQDDQNALGPVAAIRFQVTHLLAVGSDSAPGLRLAPVAPNPVAADARVTFVLPAATGATLELVDVSGRRVAQWSATTLGPGSHDVPWRTLVGTRTVAPGLYFIRLRTAAGTRVRRVSVAG